MRGHGTRRAGRAGARGTARAQRASAPVGPGRREVSIALAPDGAVVVVGASLAGLRAVQALRHGGFEGRITLVGEEHHPPYERPPLSKQVLAGTWPPERTALIEAEELGSLGVDLRLGYRAESFDAAARRVVLDDGAVLEADGVVLATGARPRRLGLGGGDGLVHVLRTLEDAARLRARIEEVGPGCRVVVVGAGFIGSEVAATCSGLGCTVTVLEALPTPLAPALGEQVGAALGRLHVAHGVDLRTSVAVESVRPGPAAAVVLASGEVVPADVVVVGVGVIPSTEWLAGSGLDVADGVRCDEALFAADGVVAAGDVARWRWRHHDEHEEVRIEHWEVAAQMGAAAARSLLAGRAAAAAFDPVPYFWSDQYGKKIQVLGRPDPADDVAVVEGTLDATGNAGTDDAGRFVVLYGRRGRLSAVLGVSRPRQVMAFRRLLVEGASFDEARSHLERA